MHGNFRRKDSLVDKKWRRPIAIDPPAPCRMASLAHGVFLTSRIPRSLKPWVTMKDKWELAVFFAYLINSLYEKQIQHVVKNSQSKDAFKWYYRIPSHYCAVYICSLCVKYILYVNINSILYGYNGPRRCCFYSLMMRCPPKILW